MRTYIFGEFTAFFQNCLGHLSPMSSKCPSSHPASTTCLCTQTTHCRGPKDMYGHMLHYYRQWNPGDNDFSEGGALEHLWDSVQNTLRLQLLPDCYCSCIDGNKHQCDGHRVKWWAIKTSHETLGDVQTPLCAINFPRVHFDRHGAEIMHWTRSA